MKKTLFLLATAAIALASCSSDDTIAENMSLNAANEINFNALTTGITRAADVNLPTNGFWVTALKKDQTPSDENTYFDNVQFKNASSAAYYSDNKYYWPSGYSLDFYAYSPAASGDISRTNYKTFTVTANATAASQVDFVYAVAKDWGTNTSAGNDGKNGVTINFRHAESKVAVKILNSNPNLTFEVGTVTLGNLYNKGTFTSALTSTVGDGNLTNAEWTELKTGEADAYTATFVQTYSGTLSATATQVGVDMIMIPQTINAATAYSAATTDSPFAGAYIAVQLKIKNTTNGAYIVNDGSTYLTALWPLKALTWIPGKKYIYTVDLAQGGYYSINQDDDADLDPVLEGAEIFFAEATVDDWDTTTDINIGGAISAVAGTTQNITVSDNASQYWITVTGLTETSTIGAVVTGAGTFTVTSTSSPVGSTGTSTISGNLDANANPGTPVTNTITITETGGSGTVTKINLIQP